MLSYFLHHHGNWYAIPYKERELKGQLSDKYGTGFTHALGFMPDGVCFRYKVEGIPTLRALRNNGEELPDDEIDVSDEIRSIPDSAPAAKPAALALFKRLQEALADAPAGFLPQAEYDAIIAKMEGVVSPVSDQCSRVISDPKDLQTGRFGIAARGLHHFLKVGPQWRESSLSISGIQEEVAQLADCPYCAELHASILEGQMQLVQQAEATRRLAAALQQLKALRESTDTGAYDLAISAVKSIRSELDTMECWYYGCSSKVPVKWPAASLIVNGRKFNQPICEPCARYRLDHTSIQADLNYIIAEAASEVECWNGVRDKGRSGKKLEWFRKSKEAVDCCLTDAEVASLRFYTSHSFEAINVPLRDSSRTTAHPLPAIVSLVEKGLKKLRAVGCDEKQKTVILWRGSSNMKIPEEFMADGGTELAPMSTTTDLNVALTYALKGASAPAVIFRIVTDNNLSRGPDLKWISLFPGESETLFPPLTYIQPTGKTQVLMHAGCQATVVEVRPTLA